VAAALGLSRESVSYEGQAAVELEALAAASGGSDGLGYPFAVEATDGPLLLSPAPMWKSLLRDLDRGVERPLIAARFHRGLAVAVAELAVRLAKERGVDTVALSGGVFQNKILLESVSGHLRAGGLEVLSQQAVPANDGGLALGQAVVAAALST
jgi:hydrogenase maturation protein HypF